MENQLISQENARNRIIVITIIILVQVVQIRHQFQLVLDKAV